MSVMAYDPSQPRNKDGEWTRGGGGASGKAKPSGDGAGKGKGAGGKATEFKSDDEARTWLKSTYADWRKGMSAKEDAALAFYQSPGYELMNGQFRGRKVEAPAKDLARAKEASKTLAAAIGKAPPLKESMTVYRGFSAGQFGTLTAGSTITDKGFVSTALTKSQAGSFVARGDQAMAKITLPKGTKAAAGSVKELILPPGTSFRVLSVSKSGKVTNVELEAIL